MTWTFCSRTRELDVLESTPTNAGWLQRADSKTSGPW